jgi:hypothetical protein
MNPDLYYPKFLNFEDLQFSTMKYSFAGLPFQIEVLKIVVEGEEYEKCEVNSHKRWSNEKTGSVWNDGICNAKATSADDRPTERSGLLVEVAAGKVLLEPVDMGYHKYGDKLDFLLSNRWKIDAKGGLGLPKYYSGLVKSIMEEEFGSKPCNICKMDFYLFGYVESENKEEHRAVVVLVGAKCSGDIIKLEDRKARTGLSTHYNKEIHYHTMIPIKLFLKSHFDKTLHEWFNRNA